MRALGGGDIDSSLSGDSERRGDERSAPRPAKDMACCRPRPGGRPGRPRPRPLPLNGGLPVLLPPALPMWLFSLALCESIEQGEARWGKEGVGEA